jgi:glycosyltransferase involved in cell wall biosynthesis
MNPTVSIVCPIRNMEGKLQNLHSWIRECGPQFQVILVCDSSTDKTLIELQKIQSSFPSTQIEILQGEFGSPGSARNEGMAKASNHWVVFWDSDDLGNPRVLLEELKNAEAEFLDAVISGYDIFSLETRIKTWTWWPTNPEKCIDEITLNPGVWRFCFKRSSLRDLTFPKLRMAEDQLFLNAFLMTSPRLAFSNAVTYQYFVNVENQLTSQAHALEDLSQASNELYPLLRMNSDCPVFTLRIYGKILLTQVKKCRLSTKIKSIVWLIYLFLRFPGVTTQLFLDIVSERAR